MSGQPNGNTATTAAMSADEGAQVPADPRATWLEQEGDEHQDEVDRGRDQQDLVAADG